MISSYWIRQSQSICINWLYREETARAQYRESCSVNDQSHTVGFIYINKHMGYCLHAATLYKSCVNWTVTHRRWKMFFQLWIRFAFDWWLIKCDHIEWCAINSECHSNNFIIAPHPFIKNRCFFQIHGISSGASFLLWRLFGCGFCVFCVDFGYYGWMVSSKMNKNNDLCKVYL